MGEYYQGAENLTGVELANFLHDLISTDVQAVTYANAKVALAEADVDPNDQTKVLTIYSRESVNREWDSKSWHREHVWPNSRLGVERVDENDSNIASDLHNLRAIVPRVNSSRGNKIFDITTDSDSFYPGDDCKGDVARILFYMVIRYPHLKLVDEDLDNNPETNYTLEGAKMAKFSILLQWHREDPVDDFERNRNDVIYDWQNNRNPFIDHPEFAAMIFEDESNPLTYNTVILFIERKRNFVWN
ncbi:MAG TPA: ribonuclease [Acholeplasmataceae bacterium]|nr:ribonuclease [Acholeplasmataceae bacterium]